MKNLSIKILLPAIAIVGSILLFSEVMQLEGVRENQPVQLLLLAGFGAVVVTAMRQAVQLVRRAKRRGAEKASAPVIDDEHERNL